jgi:flagellar basal body P-ring protein FlgI
VDVVVSSLGPAKSLKGGRLLNLMFMAGAPGTEQDVAGMRAVARKALAAF